MVQLICKKINNYERSVYLCCLLEVHEVRAAPIIMEETTAPCDSTLNLMRYLEVDIGPRNRYAYTP